MTLLVIYKLFDLYRKAAVKAIKVKTISETNEE